MIRAKNYETVFKFVKVMPQNTVACFFSGHSVHVHSTLWHDTLAAQDGSFRNYRKTHIKGKRQLIVVLAGIAVSIRVVFPPKA